MAMQASAYGRIGREPTTGTTQSGKTWANASMVINIDRDHDAPGYWLQIVAFGKVADELLCHGKGDLVSVSGNVQVSRWMDKQSGQAREQLQIVADTVISAKTVRPSNGKRKNEEAPQPKAETQSAFDDEVPW